MANVIEHPCNFCKRPVKLSVENRTFECRCGVVYRYAWVGAKAPGKGFAERQRAKKAAKAEV